MTLRDLEAKFLTYNSDKSMDLHEDFTKADGIIFLCPKCYELNKGSVSTHSVICWFTGKVPDDATPKPGRWNPSGTSLNDLTFVPPGAISVLLTSRDGCGWHGFIDNGFVRNV